jgi:hypothetical protein
LGRRRQGHRGPGYLCLPTGAVAVPWNGSPGSDRVRVRVIALPSRVSGCRRQDRVDVRLNRRTEHYGSVTDRPEAEQPGT